MEHYHTRPISRPVAIAGMLLIALVLSGPAGFSRVTGFVTSLVTYPFTRDLVTESNRFEIRNAQILFVYIVAVVGLNLFFQVGYKSIGQSAAMLIGAYTLAISVTTHGLPFAVGVLLAVVVAGVSSLLLGLPVVRLSVFTFVMVTIGYSFVAEDMVYEWRGLTGGGNGLSGIARPAPFDSVESYYWLVAGTAAFATIFGRNWLRSEFGSAGKAGADNPVAAQSLGVPLGTVKVRAFAVAGALAGLAGAMYAPLFGFIAPEGFTVNLSILFVLMVLLGGSGTVWGPIVGAVILLRVPIAVEDMTSQSGEWSLLVYGLILVLSVHFLPQGFVSFISALRSRRNSEAESDAAMSAGATVEGLLSTSNVRSKKDDLICLSVAKCTFGIGGLQILDRVDLDVPTGSVAAVIGPNGSGKTTLLNVVSGLVTPDSVRIEFLGDDITNVSPDGRARLGLARTFQTPLLFDQMSCLDNVLVAIDRVEPKDSAGALLRLPRWRKAEHSKIERATEILDALGLGAKADAPARSLTPGERRLLELSRVIGLGPRLVLMDEPAAGLTEPEIEILEQLIRELVGQGVAVVLVEHHVDVVMRLADQVTALDFGEVIAHGLPDAVRRDPAVVGAYFGDQDAELADPPLSGAVGPGGEDGDD